MKLIILVFFLVSANIFAQDSIGNMKISKEQIANALEIMRSQGKISEEEYLRTKKDLNLMNQGQIDVITKKAVGIAKKDPDKAKKLYKDMHKGNLENTNKELDKLSK